MLQVVLSFLAALGISIAWQINKEAWAEARRKDGKLK